MSNKVILISIDGMRPDGLLRCGFEEMEYYSIGFEKGGCELERVACSRATESGQMQYFLKEEPVAEEEYRKATQLSNMLKAWSAFSEDAVRELF